MDIDDFVIMMFAIEFLDQRQRFGLVDQDLEGLAMNGLSVLGDV